jgi:hypothetical protein
MMSMKKGLSRSNCAHFIIPFLCVSMAIMGSASRAAAQFDARPTVPSNNAFAPAKPEILVGALSNDQLNYGQALPVMITVSNNGLETARNVHLYCRANPGGSFTMEVVDQPYVLRDADNEDITLDDLYPGTEQQVNFSIQAPQSQQIQGEWSHNFHFNFSLATDGMAESSVGSITLSTRQGKILVIKGSFTQ